MSKQDGRWIEPEVNYVDPVRRFCAFCGRPIARRFWETKGKSGATAYCSPEHAQRNATYPNKNAKSIRTITDAAGSEARRDQGKG